MRNDDALGVLPPAADEVVELTRRGIRVGGELVADSLRTTAVVDVMNRVVDTIAVDDRVGEVAERIARGERGAHPILDADGHCVGMLSRHDLISRSTPNDALVGDVASSDVVSIGPQASLVEAMQLMSEEGVTHLPVLQDGQLVGICTRADIVRSRSDELSLERFEPGWLAPASRRRDAAGPLYLVVGNKSLGGAALTDELRDVVARRPEARFHVVVPLPAGGDLTAARQQLELQLGILGHMDVPADGEIGGADPLAAIEVALARELAEGIILSTLPPGTSRWLRANVPAGLARRIAVPAVVVYDEGPDPSGSVQT